MRIVSRSGFVAVVLVGLLLWWSPGRGFVDSMTVADGFNPYRTDDYYIAYPETWRVLHGRNQEGQDYVEFNGPATSEGAYSGRVRVVRLDDWNHTLEDQLTRFRLTAAIRKYTITRDMPVPVKGAREAHRFEVIRDSKTFRGVRVRLHGTETFALSDDGVLLDITAEAPEKGRMRAELRRVLDTVQIENRRWIDKPGWLQWPDRFDIGDRFGFS